MKLHFHKWEYWRGSSIFRYCLICKKWQFLGRGAGSDDWFDCDEPKSKERIFV